MKGDLLINAQLAYGATLPATCPASRFRTELTEGTIGAFMFFAVVHKKNILKNPVDEVKVNEADS
jgi:hypothetical protein